MRKCPPPFDQDRHRGIALGIQPTHCWDTHGFSRAYDRLATLGEFA